MSDIKLNQAGYGGNGMSYTDLGKDLDICLHLHDTTDDVLVNITGKPGEYYQWIDFELDFESARLLGEKLIALTERR